jgi:hypothetical protein
LEEKHGNCQEPSENADEINEANLAKSAAEMDEGLFIHTNTMDFFVGFRQFQAKNYL